MTNFIPIFPLAVVVYPGQNLHLHVFEARYCQMVRDCMEGDKCFGIPTVLENGLAEFGTSVSVSLIKQVHQDGSMDIIVHGLQVFRLLELIKEIPEKLYSGAIVHYPANQHAQPIPAIQPVLAAIRHLHQLLKISKEFSHPDYELRSYDVAHVAGLSLEEEYELLQLLQEDQRVEYLRLHLQKVLPVLQQMQALTDRIHLNGHFRKLSSPDTE